ncbi:MAG TPA: hypothetical protein EYP33_03685 [Pyrodictium sp.]|nr:hypothetical protein [Pyrodictium sp.]
MSSPGNVAGRCNARLALLAVLFSAISAVLTVLEPTGFTDSLDYLIFHSISPRGSVLVRLLSLTASVAAFIVYAAILVVYDIAKFGKLRLQTVALGISLTFSMIVVCGTESTITST